MLVEIIHRHESNETAAVDKFRKQKTTRFAGGGIAERADQAFGLFALAATFLRLR
jgi:hypothetical protein